VSQVPTPEITEVVDPVGHVQVIYLGPWRPIGSAEWSSARRADSGVRRPRGRPVALLAAPRPQFRRNRERVNRDAERENLLVEWNLGYEEES